MKPTKKKKYHGNKPCSASFLVKSHVAGLFWG